MTKFYFDYQEGWGDYLYFGKVGDKGEMVQLGTVNIDWEDKNDESLPILPYIGPKVVEFLEEQYENC